MKYLFDSLQSYESSYSDALCPIRDEPDKSFMGDQKALGPLTNQEFRLFHSSFMDNVDSLKTMLQAMQIPYMGTGILPAIQHLSIPPSGCLPSNRELAITADSESPWSAVPLSFHAMPVDPVLSAANCGISSEPNPIPQQPLPVSNKWTRLKPSQQRLAPLPGAVIPDIPRGPNAWKTAVEQWDSFLKDWEPWKYTGVMRLVNGTKRSLRETIALEYDACV